TGWPEDGAEKAAARCFDDWLARRGGVGNRELEHGIRQVVAFIEAHGSSRFEAAWESSQYPERIVNRAGFRKRNDAEGWEYMILPEAWRGEVCKGSDAAAIAGEMVKRGLMVAGGDRATKLVKVPNNGATRLYVLATSILGAVTAVTSVTEPRNTSSTNGL